MAEAAVNPVMPMRNTRRLPKRSPRRPDDKQHAHGQGVASPEPLISDSPPPSCRAIDGAAMVVIVESMRSKMSARSTTARIAGGARQAGRVGRILGCGDLGDVGQAGAGHGSPGPAFRPLGRTGGQGDAGEQHPDVPFEAGLGST